MPAGPIASSRSSAIRLWNLVNSRLAKFPCAKHGGVEDEGVEGLGLIVTSAMSSFLLFGCDRSLHSVRAPRSFARPDAAAASSSQSASTTAACCEGSRPLSRAPCSICPLSGGDPGGGAKALQRDGACRDQPKEQKDSPWDQARYCYLRLCRPSLRHCHRIYRLRC